MPDRQLPLFPSADEHALTRHSPLKDAIPPFLEHLRKEGRSPHTISAFRSDLKLLSEHFGEETPLVTFTTRNLTAFMEWIEHGRGVPCSRKSYARRVTTLKVFFKYLKAEGVLPHDPAEALLQRSGAAPLQPILSEDAIRRMLAHTLSLRLDDKKPDARPDLLLRLLLDTGIKKSECMRLTLADIERSDPEHPVLIVRHRTPNTYKERKIPLDADWLRVLDEYVAQYRPEETLFTCTARNLEYILHNVAKAAGVEEKTSFEVLRWTSAVRAYRQGMDLERLREKMGLSRISWRETSDKIKRLAALQAERERAARSGGAT